MKYMAEARRTGGEPIIFTIVASSKKNRNCILLLPLCSSADFPQIFVSGQAQRDMGTSTRAPTNETAKSIWDMTPSPMVATPNNKALTAIQSPLPGVGRKLTIVNRLTIAIVAHMNIFKLGMVKNFIIAGALELAEKFIIMLSTSWETNGGKIAVRDAHNCTTLTTTTARCQLPTLVLAVTRLSGSPSPALTTSVLSLPGVAEDKSVELRSVWLREAEATAVFTDCEHSAAAPRGRVRRRRPSGIM